MVSSDGTPRRSSTNGSCTAVNPDLTPKNVSVVGHGTTARALCDSDELACYASYRVDTICRSSRVRPAARWPEARRAAAVGPAAPTASRALYARTDRAVRRVVHRARVPVGDAPGRR